MSKLKYFLTFIILISYCFKFDAKSLDIPIIVIAPNKNPQSYSTVGSSVSIINQETISNSNNFFLGETLDKNLPGMNYFRSGGYGTVSGIQLRGLPKRYSTVYIDGVKMSDPSSSDNSFYFSNIIIIMLRTAVARVCFTMTYRLYRGDSPLYPALPSIRYGVQ